jgi:hypothetical protein
LFLTHVLDCSVRQIRFSTRPHESTEARSYRSTEARSYESGGRLGAVDRILAKLAFGNVAFNAPKTMNLHETAVIQLLLSLETPIDELKQMVEAAGEKEGEQIRVYDRMQAHLSGPNFAITAITDETQAVSRSNITEWKWEVKPNSGGRHNLHLTMEVLLSVDGASTPRGIRTFDKVIEVEVAWHQRVGSFFENNWQWLWAAILVPIIGWLWKRKKASKPDVSQSDS